MLVIRYVAGWRMERAGVKVRIKRKAEARLLNSERRASATQSQASYGQFVGYGLHAQGLPGVICLTCAVAIPDRDLRGGGILRPGSSR